MGTLRVSSLQECHCLPLRQLHNPNIQHRHTQTDVVLLFQFDFTVRLNCVNVRIGLLLPSRIRRKGDFGNHHIDVIDLLHEHGDGHAAPVVGDAAHRHLLFVHHDHGGKFRRMYDFGAKLSSSIGSRGQHAGLVSDPLSSMDSMVTSHASTWEKDYATIYLPTK